VEGHRGKKPSPRQPRDLIDWPSSRTVELPVAKTNNQNDPRRSHNNERGSLPAKIKYQVSLDFGLLFLLKQRFSHRQTKQSHCQQAFYLY